MNGDGRPAAMLAAVWSASLVLLAVLWVRSPFTGPGPMFFLWSAVTAPLLASSWRLFRRWRVQQLPRSGKVLAGIGVAWAGLAALSLSGVGPEMAMDGLIMRDALARTAGTVLEWLPGCFGLVLAVAGLAASLEARYRLAHGEAG